MEEIHCIPIYYSMVKYTDSDFQEGYNSKTNRTLEQSHPSPGIQLTNVMNQIMICYQESRLGNLSLPKELDMKILPK